MCHCTHRVALAEKGCWSGWGLCDYCGQIRGKKKAPLTLCQRGFVYFGWEYIQVPLSNRGRFDANLFGRSAIGSATFDTLFSNAVEGCKSFFSHVAEVSVVRSQSGVRVVEEELRTIGVSTSVCHGDRTARVDGLNIGVVHLVCRVFVGELEAGTARARTGWVTTLQDRKTASGHAVADGVVVIALVHQIGNRVDCTRCQRAVELHRDFTLVGGEVNGNGAFRGDVV